MQFVLLILFILQNFVVLIMTLPNFEREISLKDICRTVPFDDDLTAYRYDPKTSECHQLNRQGPCGENMDFYQQLNSTVYGVCDCQDYHNRKLIYHAKTDQCYFIFKQAYCPEGEWLTLSKTSGKWKPVCETNPCQSHQNNKTGKHSHDFVLFKNHCVELWSQSPTECENGEYVDFVKDELLPRCTHPEMKVGNIQEPSTTPCPPDAPRSISGRCQKHWDF